jgi:RimJ/RimL family protein N-acetyltransferase
VVVTPRPELSVAALHTERLDLTVLDPDADAPDLHAMLADPEVHRYDSDAKPARSVAGTRRRLSHQVMANGGASWAIRLHGGPAIGTIGVFADQGTTIRGIGWSLARQHWRRGITSEAARAVVPYLLGQPGVDGLEAWVDSANVASLGVARAGGLAEVARLPRVYPDRVAQTIVMARAAEVSDPAVFGVGPIVPVVDVRASARLLQDAFALHLAWAYPDPPSVVSLAVAPWSGAQGLQLVAREAPIAPLEFVVDLGIHVAEVRRRLGDASPSPNAPGLVVLEEPADMPWYRCEMVVGMPEGHRIRVSGPSTPSLRDD